MEKFVLILFSKSVKLWNLFSTSRKLRNTNGGAIVWNFNSFKLLLFKLSRHFVIFVISYLNKFNCILKWIIIKNNIIYGKNYINYESLNS